MAPRTITLTTDFGYQDPFVGTMKGVILTINPNTRLVDLTHGLPAQDVLAGALALSTSTPFFPRGTIHVAVVDPGVGSDRRALAIESEGHFFVGPDNGIFTLVLRDREVRQIIDLCNDHYHLKPTSRTFHGRDIFAPVAAYLSLGVPAKEMGTPVQEFHRLPWPEVTRAEGAIRGRIVYIDRFGNLLTNIAERDLKAIPPEKATVSVGPLTIRGLASHYSSGNPTGYLALINSSGLLEISLFKGNAHLSSGAKIGDEVLLRESRSPL